MRIDLNADLGEECGDDEALLAVVTSANVACGGHAGGGAVLERTVAAAVAAGVRVGAHPSYPDRAEFGRVSRRAEHTDAQLRRLVADQVRQVARACAAHGAACVHVKPHGALYNDAAVDPAVAEAVVAGAQDALGGGVVVLGPPGSRLEDAARTAGLRFEAEGFADRRYLGDGTLVPRSRAGAVVDDPDAAVGQGVDIATGVPVVTLDGASVTVPAETLCVHGDSPGAVLVATRLRAALLAAGVDVGAP